MTTRSIEPAAASGSPDDGAIPQVRRRGVRGPHHAVAVAVLAVLRLEHAGVARLVEVVAVEAAEDGGEAVAVEIDDLAPEAAEASGERAVVVGVAAVRRRQVRGDEQHRERDGDERAEGAHDPLLVRLAHDAAERVDDGEGADDEAEPHDVARLVVDRRRQEVRQRHHEHAEQRPERTAVRGLLEARDDGGHDEQHGEQTEERDARLEPREREGRRARREPRDDEPPE